MVTLNKISMVYVEETLIYAHIGKHAIHFWRLKTWLFEKLEIDERERGGLEDTSRFMMTYMANIKHLNVRAC